MKKHIKLIELFAGYGSQLQALKNIGADVESWRCVEFDKYAVKSFNAVHGTNYEVTDIRDIAGSDLGITDCENNLYLMTYSFPCTDISLAGKCEGMKKGSGTRSGLLWEVERLLNECEVLPQILLMENVPQVHSAKNLPDFEEWISFLESKGYHNEYKDLNAMDYGVPQSRKRCFMVSTLGDIKMTWPDATPLKLRVKDLLEDEVDDKYYMAQDKADKLLKDYAEKIEQKRSVARLNAVRIDSTDNDTAKTLCARDYKGYGTGFDTMNGVIETTIGALRGRDKSNYNDRTSGNPNLEQCLEPREDECSNTLTTVSKDNIVIEDFYKNRPARFYEDTAPTLRSDRTGLKVTEEKEVLVYDDYNSKVREDQNTIGTIGTTIGNAAPRNSYKIIEKPKFEYKTRIRRLTPKECFRLMGVKDSDADKMLAVNSASQCYKQAGNSIVIPVLEAIFKGIEGVIV